MHALELAPLRLGGGVELGVERGDLAHERLRKIGALTGELGLNLAGATRVLDLEDAMEALAREVAALHAKLDAAAEEQRRELERVHRSYRRDLVIYQTPKSPVPWTFRS